VSELVVPEITAVTKPNSRPADAAAMVLLTKDGFVPVPGIPFGRPQGLSGRLSSPLCGDPFCQKIRRPRNIPREQS
jgi:hypothetical protein